MELGDPPPAKSTNVNQASMANLIRPKKGERFGGRRIGSINRRARAVNIEAARIVLGITPLEGMLEAAALSRGLMLEAWDGLLAGKVGLEEFLTLNAQTSENMAKCAPYCHQRLQTVRPDGELPPLDLEQLTDQQIDILVFRLGAGRRLAGPTIDATPAEGGAPGQGGDG